MANRNLAVPPWVSAILNDAGAPITDANAKLLEFWAQTENGSGWEAVVPGTGQYAAPGTGVPIYNPFNVISPPGVAQTGSQGDIQVYPGWKQGAAANADFLKQSSGASLLQAMRNGADLGTLYNSINWRTYTGTTGGDYMPALTAYLAGQGPGPAALYSGGATTNYTPAAPGSSTSGAPPSTISTGGAATGGCAAKISASTGTNYIFTIPHTSWGPTYCNIKAFKGALLVGAGAGILIFGVALVVIATGIGGKGPIAPVASFVTGGRIGNKASKVANSTPSSETIVSEIPDEPPERAAATKATVARKSQSKRSYSLWESPNPPLQSLKVNSEERAA